jgi:penicillin-binding protein 2
MLIFDQLKKNDPPLRVLTLAVLAGLAVLLGGLYYVQVVAGRYYAENQKTQSFRTVRIPAIRGQILDRHGLPLAENQPCFTVNLYLEELRGQFAEEWSRSRPRQPVTHTLPRWKRWLGVRPPTTEYVKLRRDQRFALESQARYRVASNLVWQVGTSLQHPLELDSAQFLKHYSNQLALPLPLLVNLRPEQVARFEEQTTKPVGLDLEIQPLRHYPRGLTAAHLVGHLVRDDSSMKDEDAFFNFRLPDYKGLLGIEAAFDAELRGRAGVKSVLVNNLGYRQSEEIWTPAEPGKNVVLTLDLALQEAVEQALQTASPDVVRGAAIVLDPNNGDLLALASSPSYDPNVFLPRIRAADYERLSDEWLKPQRNRATQEIYPPGSIFKVVTAMACLEAGLDPKEILYNPGFIKIGRWPAIDDTAPAGEYDFKRAFIKSSNTYFITNGLRAGVEHIIRIGQRLHLGERTGLPTRQDSGGYFPTLQRVRRGWYDGHTANLCIGQGEIAITPLQMAVMVAAVANGGQVYWPRLVQRVEPHASASGEAGVVYPPGRLRDTLNVSRRTLQLIRDAMLADTEEPGSTAFYAFHEADRKTPLLSGWRVCAKTGTAQVTDEQNRVVDHTTWIATYAPYENPRYVVLVMVEGGVGGGTTCGPVAAKIYQAIQRHEQRPPPRGATWARHEP